MIFIYKELIKKYINLLTIDHIKNYALTNNEVLSNEEATIIYNHIKTYYKDLLEKDTSSFVILEKNIRKDLFNKIIKLYSEMSSKYL